MQRKLGVEQEIGELSFEEITFGERSFDKRLEAKFSDKARKLRVKINKTIPANLEKIQQALHDNVEKKESELFETEDSLHNLLERLSAIAKDIQLAEKKLSTCQLADSNNSSVATCMQSLFNNRQRVTRLEASTRQQLDKLSQESDKLLIDPAFYPAKKKSVLGDSDSDNDSGAKNNKKSTPTK